MVQGIKTGTREPFLWLGIDRNGVANVTIQASNERQEMLSLAIYAMVRPVFQEIDKAIRERRLP